MKLNQKLIERLQKTNIDPQQFIKKIEEYDNKKLEPEQFLNSTKASNFRVRNLNQQEEAQSTKQPPLTQNYSKQDFVKEQDMQASQLTRATTIQNSSYITQASPSNSFFSKHRVIGNKNFQALLEKKGITPQSIKISTVELAQEQENKQMVPIISKRPISSLSNFEQVEEHRAPVRPVILKKSVLPKPPIVSQNSHRKVLNTSGMLNNQNTSQLMVQSTNNSQIISANNSIIGNQQSKPPSSAFNARIRGSSQKLQTQVIGDVSERKNVSQIKQMINTSLNQSGLSIRRMSQTINQSFQNLDEIETNLEMLDIMNEDKLLEITQKSYSDLDSVNILKLRFNSANDSLQLLGELLPNLKELKLNNSIISSLRDLGTRMQNIKILWIQKSQLKDLSGINAFPLLQELYCGFNNISDLSPIAYHDSLQILDLEANEISDEYQIDFLETISQLESLNITANPLFKTSEMRNKIRERLLRVEIIDDIESDLDIDDDIQVMNLELGNRIEKFYDVVSEIVEDINDFKQIEMQIQIELNKDQGQEPNEMRLLAEQIKSKTNDDQKKPKQTNKEEIKRPQTAMVKSVVIETSSFSSQKQKDQFQKFLEDPDPTSNLLQTEEQFCGNPLKAAKEKNKNKRKFDFDPSDRKSMDIRNILKQFQK